MKNFTFAVFVWFLCQLILLSMASATNGLEDAQAVASGKAASIAASQAARCDVQHINPGVARVMTLIMPLAETTLVKGEWCWQN